MYDAFYKEQLEYLFFSIKQEVLSNHQMPNIYRMLANFGVDSSLCGYEILDNRDRCASYAFRLIRDVLDEDRKKGRTPSIRTRIQLQNNNPRSFQHINVVFDPAKQAGVRSMLKLYFPLDINQREVAIRDIYQYLFQEKINFSSKISPTIRSDNFVVRVDSVEDAKKLIDYAASTPSISSAICMNNPLVAQIHGIGIAQDTYEMSYNMLASQEMQDFLRDCCGKNELSKFDAEHFLIYLKDKYAILSNSKQRFGVKTLIDSLNCILQGSSFLENCTVPNRLSFDPALFYQYRRYLKDDVYLYRDGDNREITMESDPAFYIHLQAMNCLEKMYQERFQKRPNTSFVLHHALSNYLHVYLDRMQDITKENSTINDDIQLSFPYENRVIQNLFPYLCADLALQNGRSTIEEVQEIMDVVTRRTVFERDDDISLIEKNRSSKQCYLWEDKRFSSSIPLITMDRGIVGLDFVDDFKQDNVMTITVIKNGKMIQYQRVVLEVDRNLLMNLQDETSCTYRSFVGNLLLDETRNKKMIDERGGHFGIIRYSSDGTIQKYYDPHSIKKLKDMNLEPSVEVVEQKSSRIR